jgi:hypothetical protein
MHDIFWEICALGSVNLGTLIWTLASLKSIVAGNTSRLTLLEPDIEDLRERVSKLETINECNDRSNNRKLVSYGRD